MRRIINTINRLTQMPDGCPTTELVLKGISLNFIIDSGTRLNIISKNDFVSLPNKPKLNKSRVKAYGFNSVKPVPILGEFSAQLNCGNKSTMVKFMVFDGSSENLLGYRAAMALGIMEVKPTKIVAKINRIAANITGANSKTNSSKPIRLDIDMEVAERFPRIFEERIGCMKDVEIEIEVENGIKPKQIPSYPIPLHLQPFAKAKLDKMEANGVIEKATGKLTWIHPVHVVEKLDPITREVVDARITSNCKQLNKHLILQKRSMPSVRELSHDLNGMQFFSKVDIKDAFNQILIRKEDRHFTTFSTPWGLYWYNRLNMGLSIASELFQSIMSDKLKHIPNCKQATDDIIVYGHTYEEARENLLLVLVVLDELELTVNKKKCVFLKREIDFYGMKISSKGLKPLEPKMTEFKNMEAPTNRKELQSFLGIGAHFASRTPYYANRTRRLRALLKDGKWHWDPEHLEEFADAKQAVLDMFLAHYNPRWITELIVDAGPEGCASFLTQVNPEDKNERVLIHCASHTFNAAEINYSHLEKEAFAIVWACEHDHIHLYG